MWHHELCTTVLRDCSQYFGYMSPLRDSGKGGSAKEPSFPEVSQATKARIPEKVGTVTVAPALVFDSFWRCLSCEGNYP
jgi:hypothetical protein